MNLRPHHLLCIQKFTGHGYDEVFTLHMTSVVSELTEHPFTQITMTKGRDDLCQKCPHNKNGICSSLEKVDHMDKFVLHACGLAYGDCDSWKSLADKARKQIFETDAFYETCGGCQWFALCESTEKSCWAAGEKDITNE